MAATRDGDLKHQRLDAPIVYFPKGTVVALDPPQLARSIDAEVDNLMKLVVGSHTGIQNKLFALTL